MDEIEISEYGNLLIYKSNYSARFVEKVIRDNNLAGLRIFDYFDQLESLDFLRQFGFLRRLDITCRYAQDYDFLKSLPQLISLSVGPLPKTVKPIDLSNQKNVEYLSLQWQKRKIKGLEYCENVRSLVLVEYTENDLSMLSRMNTLEVLKIKTASIETLHGLEDLANLEKVQLGNCRKLVSISALSGSSNLSSLEIELCRHIKDYKNLIDLPKLSLLRLTDCGVIEALGFADNFPALENIVLTGDTRVL